MDRSTRKTLYTVALGYAGFAALNGLLGWLNSTERTKRQPGDSKFLDWNDSLLKYNLLARVANIQPAYILAPMVTLPDDVVIGPPPPPGPGPLTQFNA